MNRLTGFLPFFSKQSLIIAVLIGLSAALPLWQPGFLNTKAAGETPYLLARVQAISAALDDGQFPVRWMPDGAFGLGYPFFNFYGALPYYIAALFEQLGFGIITGLKLTHTLGFILGAVGTTLWLRRHTTAAAALFGAAVFTFMPMHMVNVYVRGDSLSEFWAMNLFPWILWGLDRLIAKPHPARLAFLGLMVAGLVVSHNISALLFAPLAALYALVYWAMNGRRWRVFFALAISAGLALLLSAWFWLPALAESTAVQTEGRMLEGYFYWGSNFLNGDLFGRDFFYDYAQFPPHLNVWMIALPVLGTIGLIIHTVLRRKVNIAAFWGLGVFLFSLAMTQSFSTPFYEHIPMLEFIQFPWRWLTIAAIGGAAVAAMLITVIPQSRTGWRWTAAALAITVTIFSGLTQLDLDFLPIKDEAITGENMAVREAYSGDIGTTVTTEYLPESLPGRFFSGPLLTGLRPLLALDGSATGIMRDQTSTRQTWTIFVESESAQVAVPILYFPGWQAKLRDGTRLETVTVPNLGWLAVEVPNGTQTVIFSLKNTGTRRAADILGLIGVLLTVAFVIAGYRSKLPRAHREAAITVGMIMIILSGLGIFAPQPDTNGPQAAQFARNSLHHPYPQGLIVAYGVRLTTVDYPQTAHPGNDLAFTLSGEIPPETVFHIELIPALNNLWGQDAALAVAEGQSSMTMTLPDTAPPGVYFPRLMFDNIAYDLAPITINAGFQICRSGPSLADFGDHLRLMDVNFVELDRGRLNVWLNWHVTSSIADYYGIALRLHSPSGAVIAAHDGPMGAYGGYPTPYWQDHISDWVTLGDLEGLPPGEGYTLSIGITSMDGSVIGFTELRDLTLQTSPEQGSSPVETFTGTVEPQRREIEQGDRLPLTVTWQGPVEDGWQIAWTLDDSPIATTDLTPGARLDWWLPNQQYTATLPLRIPADLVPGEHLLRWQVIDATEQTILQGEAGAITVLASSREFAPEDAAPLAVFGPLDLLAVEPTLENETLSLALTWAANAQPEQDVVMFVHIFNPDDGFVPAQADTRPRDGTYPVTAWITNEQVRDTVSIDLTNLAPGPYGIAIGWYDPATWERVSAVNTDGEPLADGRYVLPVTLDTAQNTLLPQEPD